MARLGYRWIKAKRLRVGKTTQSKRVKTFLKTPLPAVNASASLIDIIAIDIEMSGLDSTRHKIVSIGWIKIQSANIRYRTAKHFIVSQEKVDLNNTASIHGIFHEHIEKGVSISHALEQLLMDAEGCVMLFHHAKLDCDFLQRAFQEEYKSKLPLLFIDSMVLERRLSARKQLRSGDYTLGRCRTRYGLPYYSNHNAVIDAIATAELLLAQIQAQGRADQVKLLDCIDAGLG